MLIEQLTQQLTELLQNGNKKIDTLSMKFTATDIDLLPDLIDLIKANKLEINKIEIDISEEVPILDLSYVVSELNQILKHIKELKALKLGKPVIENTLSTLLENESILKLEKLELTHGSRNGTAGDRMANSKEFFNTTLVSYLSKNTALKELVINDPQGDITAAKYPQLKSAISEHPTLTKFSLGLSPSKYSLDKDIQLVAKLEKNVKDTDEKKARLIGDSITLTTQAFNINNTLNRMVPSHFVSRENIWEKATRHLTDMLFDLINAKRELAKLNDGDDTIAKKVALLEILINYFILVKHVTAKRATLNGTDLSVFWTVTRFELLNKIQRIEDNNYSQLALEIKNENQKLKNLGSNILPVTFPSSYKQIADKQVDRLDQAVELLNDYTKDNSATSRFFHGHWNRHHVSEVNSIVKRVSSDIKSVDELLTELNAIYISNPKGSLAKRILYIEQHCLVSDEQERNVAQLR